MVRGFQNCPEFCTRCNIDCTCGECNRCHTCSHRYHSGINLNCNRFYHDCINARPDSTMTIEQIAAVAPTHILNAGARLSQYLASDTMKIIIPSPEKSYSAHISVLEKSAGYFKSLFSSRCSETQTKSVVLDIKEVDTPQAIEIFLQFCYLGDYDMGGNTPMKLLGHTEAYIFAERVQSSGLKALALKKLVALFQTVGSHAKWDLTGTLAKMINLVYEHTPPRVENIAFMRPSESPVDGLSGARSPQHNTWLQTTQNPRNKFGITRYSGRLDQLRLLLAAVSAANLGVLRESVEFIEMHRSFPEFSLDLLLFVGQGKAIKANADGSMDLGFAIKEVPLSEKQNIGCGSSTIEAKKA